MTEEDQPSRGQGRRLVLAAIIGGLAFVGWKQLTLPEPGVDIAAPRSAAPAAAASDYAPPDDTGFVGSQACAACHADIAEQYAAHPMARSTRRLQDMVAEADGACTAAVVPGRQRVLTVSCDAGRPVHHEKMFDDAGTEIYDQAVSLDYVVGSGERAMAYLHRRDDLLFMSPLNWYRDGSHWDLAPGYSPDDVRRFDRRATEQCLGCHAGRVAIAERGANVFPDPVFHEMQIGCERCHGPGAAHVAFHSGTPTRAGEPDPIVDPSELDIERRESVCYQCHLSAAAHVLRPGRSHLDFRPGMKLSDVWVFLDTGAEVDADGRTRSVNHVQQMRDSRCFEGSSGQMGCISCHDPHRVPTPETRVEFYRGKCLNCHAGEVCSLPAIERQERDNSCIACHMPSRDSSHMDHVAQTDHRILRRPSAETAGSGQEAVANLSFFADMHLDLPPEEQQRSLALGEYMHRARKQLPQTERVTQSLEQALLQFPQDATLLSVLGELTLQSDNPLAARRYFEQATELGGIQEAAWDGLMQVSYQLGDWGTALEFADKLLDVDPGDARIHSIRGDALMNLGRIDEGIAAVRRATELNPGLVPPRAWLVEIYRRTGRDEERRREEATLERILSAEIPEQMKRGQTRDGSQ